MNVGNNMKKNRSNKFTQGIVITNNTNDKRFLFFELDKPFNFEDHHKVYDVYLRFGLDLIIHRTGNGWHFLSPTLIDLETWKEAMKVLKEIEHGAIINITSRGKVVAKLIPPEYSKEIAKKKLKEISKTAVINDVISPVDVQWKVME